MPTLLLLLCVGGCSYSFSGGQIVIRGATMGTTYSVKVAARDGSTPDPDRLRRIVEAELDAVDRAMSTYRPDSELSRFNASDSTDWLHVSPPTAAVVAEAIRIGRASSGAYDVTVEPLVRLWNFGADARPDDAVPSDAAIEEQRKLVGQEHLAVRPDPPAIKKDLPGLQVDLSSIAKGFAVDCVAERLDEEGRTDYMVEIGGEVRTRGTNGTGEPWHIAIERPTAGSREAYRVVALSDGSMATSGDYRNYFERDGRRYSHLIDPRTGRPIAHRLASVTVLADRCVEADALATALAVLGPEAGMELARREDVATLFLVRQRDGFVERRSAAWPTEKEEVDPSSLDAPGKGRPFGALIASLLAFGFFMLVLAAGVVLRRRKMQCACKTAARIMDTCACRDECRKSNDERGTRT